MIRLWRRSCARMDKLRVLRWQLVEYQSRVSVARNVWFQMRTLPIALLLSDHAEQWSYGEQLNDIFYWFHRLHALLHLKQISRINIWYRKAIAWISVQWSNWVLQLASKCAWMWNKITFYLQYNISRGSSKFNNVACHHGYSTHALFPRIAPMLGCWSLNHLEIICRTLWILNIANHFVLQVLWGCWTYAEFWTLKFAAN